MPERPPEPRAGDGEARIVDLAMQTRADVRMLPETVDAERRSVELVWSTGAAVRRRDPWTGKRYDEVLSLEETHVDLGRLNGGAPLLNTHGAWDLSDVIGVVERAWIAREGEALVGRARVRFSDREAVEPIWRDVAAGIIRNVSVGYSVKQLRDHRDRGRAAHLARRRLAAARALRRAGRRRRRRRLPRRRSARRARRPRHQPLPPAAPRPGAHPRGAPDDPRRRDRDRADDRCRSAGRGGSGRACRRAGADRRRGPADPRCRPHAGGDAGAVRHARRWRCRPRRGRSQRRRGARPRRGAASDRHDPRRRAQARRRRHRSPTTSSPAAWRSTPPAPH